MKNIGVLTTTFYENRQDTRFHLACQMIGNADGAGHTVFIVNGSLNRDIDIAFEKIGSFVEPQQKPGMGESRRQLFRRRPGFPHLRVYLWTEPEKADLIRLIPEIIAPIERGDADIVVPARTDASFRSYPEPQVGSEKAANAVFAEVTGRELDVMFGPVAFRSSLLPIYADCNPKEQFDASDTYIQQVATMVAMSKGHRVASVPVDFYYPPIQKAEEEKTADIMREKRQKQFNDLTHAFRVVGKALGLTNV